MTTPKIRYNRAPSEELLKLLMPGGFLAPVVELQKQPVGGYDHDVHFRTMDGVHVYRGLTSVLTVKRLKDGRVRVGAHASYAKQPCATPLLREWNIGETGFAKALDVYLSNVEVRKSHTDKEGHIQLIWSRVNEPWVPFDREVVLSYRSTEHRQSVKDFAQVAIAHTKLIQISSTGIPPWPAPSEPSKGRSEIDQIAVDQDGCLVLIELKDASAAESEVYYAPYQLLQYVWEWHKALQDVLPSIQKVIDARVAAGLTPKVRSLTGKIRAAVCFGADTRSPEVKRRYAKVLEVVNQHLPPSVAPIETWALENGGPRQLSP